jgi:hypothetical protein
VVEHAIVVVVCWGRCGEFRRNRVHVTVGELGAPPDHLDVFAALELEVDVLVFMQHVRVVDVGVFQGALDLAV